VIGELRPDRKISKLNGHIVPKSIIKGKAYRRFDVIGFAYAGVYELDPIKRAKFYLSEVRGRSHGRGYLILAIEAAN
jgi:hypothetical protein